MKGITLVPATTDDAQLLFKWVNAQDSLINREKSAEPIDLETHIDWLDRNLSNPDFHLFLLSAGGGPIGQLRLQPTTEGYEVDIYVTPPNRRSGIAKQALSRAIAMLTHSPLIARIKVDNRASKRLFESVGFVEVSRDEKIAMYRVE